MVQVDTGEADSKTHRIVTKQWSHWKSKVGVLPLSSPTQCQFDAQAVKWDSPLLYTEQSSLPVHFRHSTVVVLTCMCTHTRTHTHMHTGSTTACGDKREHCLSCLRQVYTCMECSQGVPLTPAAVTTSCCDHTTPAPLFTSESCKHNMLCVKTIAHTNKWHQLMCTDPQGESIQWKSVTFEVILLHLYPQKCTGHLSHQIVGW